MVDKYTPEKVQKMLDDLVEGGLLWRRWDVKNNEYIYNNTQFGNELLEALKW